MIANVEKEEGVSPQLSSIVTAQNLGDTTILQTLKTLGETGRAHTTLDQLLALIAEKILTLNLPNGGKLVFPASTLLLRNLREARADKKENREWTDDDTLTYLHGILMRTQDTADRVNAGIKLGDRGIHVASGFMTTRHIKKFMSPEELDRYSAKMSLFGYNSAIAAAERTPQNRHYSIQSNIEPLAKRFRDIVSVLQSIREQLEMKFARELLI